MRLPQRGAETPPRRIDRIVVADVPGVMSLCCMPGIEGTVDVSWLVVLLDFTLVAYSASPELYLVRIEISSEISCQRVGHT